MIFCDAKKATEIKMRDLMIYGTSYMLETPRRNYNPLRYLICKIKYRRLSTFNMETKHGTF